MLKLNSSGGKLDITIDESLFGTGKKDTVKPHKGHMVTRQSRAQGKQQTKPTKPTAASISDIGPRGRNAKQSKQGKAKSRQEKKVPRPISVSNATVAKTEESKPYDAGVISKAHLDSILLLLNTEGVSNEKRISPEGLKSQLRTSLGKNKPTELKDVGVEPNDSSLHEERNKSRNESVSSKIVKKDQENENQMYNTVQVDKEDKKLQWKRELDEQVLLKKKTKEEEKQENNKDIEDYNPWGRPGAGAPMRSQSGNVVANYRPDRKKNEIPNNENITTSNETFAAALVPSSHNTKSQSRSSPVTTVATSTSDVNTTLPVAMRSSFAIGAPGLVAHDTQTKRLKEIQWKQELQMQIEGKKERERQRKLKEAQEDFLNLSWNAKNQKQQNLKIVSPPQRTTDLSSQVSDQYEKKPWEDIQPQATQETTQETTQESSLPLNALSNSSLKTHARGFGMQLMDPQAKEEAEKKRLKMLEHQHAIQEQVEEKRRIKQREREQRLKDEAIEESRFAEEREKLNLAFIMERKQKRQKEEEAKRISEALQQSVLDAYQASQQAKADKRRKHFGATGQETGATMSRSYVVSQATSEDKHIASDSMPGIPGNNSTSPQITGRETPRTNRSIGRTSHLTGRNSPPVPTSRNKMIEKSEFTSPKSCSTVPPASTKTSLHRTVSSHSEPCDGSLALSSSWRGTKGSDAGGFATHCDKPLSDSRGLKDDGMFNRPFSTLEDAFTIPYHRTDSATLPAPPETPEPNTFQGATNVSPRVKKKKELNNQRYPKNAPQNNGETITPVYRTVSSHLEHERAEPEVSPLRAKENKSIRPRPQAQSTKSTPSHRSGSKPLRMENDKKLLKQSTNTQQRQGKKLEKKTLKDHSALRNDVSSMSSAQQVAPEPSPTARQEMILQQLAALRQGLIIKERELKHDDTIHHFNM